MKYLASLCAGLLAFALVSGHAFAQSPSTITVKPVVGPNVNVAGQSDASSNFHYRDVMEGLDSGGTPVAVTVDGSDAGLWTHVVNWPASYTIANFPATQVVSDSALETSASAIATNTSGAAKDGTDASGVTAPTGGVGIRGWLSGTYNLLKGVLAVKQVDSTGADATDTTNHAVKVNCIVGCTSGAGGAVTMAPGAVAANAYALGAIPDLGTGGPLYQALTSAAPCRSALTLPIAATDGANAPEMCDKLGRSVTVDTIPLDLAQYGSISTVSNTAFTNLSGWAAPTGNQYAVVTSYSCIRTDAGTSPAWLIFNNGSATGTSIIPLQPGGAAKADKLVPPWKVYQQATAPAVEASSSGLTVVCSFGGLNGY